MKIYHFNKRTYRMESRPIPTKNLQYSTVNDQDVGIKYRLI